jgi:hypothetical protein
MGVINGTQGGALAEPLVIWWLMRSLLRTSVPSCIRVITTFTSRPART